MASRIRELFVPVICDNPRHVREDPREEPLFREMEGWGNPAILWAVSPDRAHRVPFAYISLKHPPDLLARIDEVARDIR